jgi:hypothetical protein
VPSKPKVPPPKVVVVMVPDEDKLNVAPADNVNPARLTVVAVLLTTALITLSPEVKAALLNVWVLGLDTLPLIFNVPPPMDRAEKLLSRLPFAPAFEKSIANVPAFTVTEPEAEPTLLVGLTVNVPVPDLARKIFLAPP